MTRNEYLTRLRTALLEQRVADAEDIVSEYEAHFDFKLADGFSEEEIAARLGAPETLAAQFESGAGKPKGAGKIPTVIALCFADLVVFCFFVLLFAWTLVLAAFAICSSCSRDICSPARICTVSSRRCRIGAARCSPLPCSRWVC